MKSENKFFLEMIKIIVKENMGQNACFLIKISLKGSNLSVSPGRQHMSFIKRIGIHSMQPLQGMELQETEAQKG